MKSFREYLRESEVNEAKIEAGPNVYKNMKVGDTVINADGKEVVAINNKFEKTICLNHKTASIDKSGNVQIEGLNNSDKKEILLTLTKEEIAAIKKL